MTVKNSEKLIAHYKELIANPDIAFPSNAQVKPAGRESVVKEAKAHLADMEQNIMIRKELEKNPGKKLNQAVVLSKLKNPAEAIEKEVVTPEKKPKK